MFDKLVESASTGAELGPRRRIFAASFLFVAVLFATAVVASIYAADFDLGNDNFDIAELLSPIAEAEPKPEPEQPQQRQNDRTTQTSTELTRRELMASTQDFTRVPPVISTAVNPYRSISQDQYSVVRRGPADIDPNPNGGSSERGSGSGNLAVASSDDPSGSAPTAPPPPVKSPERKPPTQSLGVINGKATNLPHPPYPTIAKAVGADGPVNVQVMIDEEGTVVSAKAVSGHPTLRRAAEDAARRAKFTPTYLSRVAVKVTGVIVYNFKRN